MLASCSASGRATTQTTFSYTGEKRRTARTEKRGGPSSRGKPTQEAAGVWVFVCSQRVAFPFNQTPVCVHWQLHLVSTAAILPGLHTYTWHWATGSTGEADVTRRNRDARAWASSGEHEHERGPVPRAWGPTGGARHGASVEHHGKIPFNHNRVMNLSWIFRIIYMQFFYSKFRRFFCDVDHFSSSILYRCNNAKNIYIQFNFVYLIFTCDCTYERISIHNSVKLFPNSDCFWASFHR